VIETRTAKVWLDEEGIVRLVSMGKIIEGLEASQENWDAVNQVSEGKIRPLFADIRNTKPIDAESRKFYSRLQVRELISAVALVVASPLSRVVGSMFLGLNKLPVPVRLFTSEEQALLWLREFVP
jgi:hypothetical protein